MEQEWFEMTPLRTRKLGTAVWIPLRAAERRLHEGKYGHLGFKEEFFGAGSLAVPLSKRERAEALDWTRIGIGHDHASWVSDGRYVPADVYEDDDESQLGVPLVLAQRGNLVEPPTWHLHQDLVIALRLKREGDVWVALDEGYLEVARLKYDAKGTPERLEIRAEQLRDYLCARRMALRVVTYRSRSTVEDDASHITWPEESAHEEGEGMRWQGFVRPIHEEGEPFGSATAVFHSGRTDVDLEEDVPALSHPSEAKVESRSWTIHHEGRKLYFIRGELWREDWVEPASLSPRVRDDEMPADIWFITDAEGKRENRHTLQDSGGWLWFNAKVVSALVERRGGGLGWDTRDTGSVAGSPEGGVHFGVNPIGLINVFAKDIALLAEWEQRIWVGHNVTPDGGVSEELLSAQVRAIPARTQAPEEFLPKGLKRVDEVAADRLGVTIFRQHADLVEILKRCHRFRATTQEGLLALAKDLARVTADAVDASAIKALGRYPQDGQKLGSLKTLEKLLSTVIGEEDARSLMGPLFGIYELRLADAHLPAETWKDSYALVGIDPTAPFLRQGFQMLESCVTTLYRIIKVLESIL